MHKKVRGVCTLVLCLALFTCEVLRMDVKAVGVEDNMLQIVDEKEAEEVKEVEENSEDTEENVENNGFENEEGVEKEKEESTEDIEETTTETIPDENTETSKETDQKKYTDIAEKSDDTGETNEESSQETNENVIKEFTEVPKAEEGTEIGIGEVARSMSLNRSTENDNENLAETELVTISFVDTYGKGVYTISDMDEEWKTASGSVEIRLTEGDSILISVQAEEGCFIVSDAQEGYLTETQITLTWDNREEINGNIISFESKVTGTIELSDSEGVYGNEFSGQVTYAEGVNVNDTYVEWAFESTDLEISEDNYTFKVINRGEKTTTIGGKVYRNGVCLGTLTEAAYNVSRIDSNSLLTSFNICTDGENQISLMDSGEITLGKDLNFQVYVSTEYINSISHEIEKVNISYGNRTEEMQNASVGNYAVSLSVSDSDKTEAIPQVTIVLKNGGEFTFSAQKKIKVDKDAPTVSVYLVKGEEKLQKGWLSQNVDEGTKLRVDVKDVVGIAECKITLNDDDTNLATVYSDMDNSYYVEVDLEEQIANYHIYVEDIYNNCAETDYTVKVDNTLPSESVSVAFSGSNLTVSEGEVESEYLLGEEAGSITSDGHITMRFKVLDEGQSETTCSGVSKVKAVFEVTTMNGTEEKTLEFSCSGEKEKEISFCVTEEQSEPEMNYQIKRVSITDLAGNVRELSKTEDCVDDIMYLVDGRNPVVTYNYGEESVIDEENAMVYFFKNTTGTVDVADMNLSNYKIEVGNVESYQVAEIKEISLDATKGIYSFSCDADGKYQIYTEVGANQEDVEAINSDVYYSATMIVDTMAPIIEVKLFKESGAELLSYANQYYAENIEASVSVTDITIDTIEVQIYCNGSVQTSYTLNDFSQNLEKGIYTLDSSMSVDGEYYLEVICKDKAGRESRFISDIFYIDKTAPQVSITYDNNNAQNEIYYNAIRKATIKVEDFSLSEGSVYLKIDTAKGNVPILSEWTEEKTDTGKCFTAYVSFTVDDAYDVSFSCNDRAGNRSEVCDGGYFVIDRTSPIVSIDFDNDLNENEIYYNSDRTAYVTVEDLSFDKNSFTVSNADRDKVISVNSSGAWSETEVYHTTEILCTEEGAYQFTVSAKDLAGNAAVTIDSSYFIIDKTAPEIEITGITNESANQGDVVPFIEYRDKYLDDENSQVQISGYKNGIVNVNTTITSQTESRSIQYDAFPKMKEMDDIYTLTVHIEDKAGNESEEKYLFSVNRFGSTFSIDEATAELVEKYYTNEEQAVGIMEVNVDKLQKREITISYNGEPHTLKEGEDYDVVAQGDNATWKSYTYNISEEAFKKEGQYTVTVFTQDKANNQSDNNAQGLEIAFAVDKTAPSIVVSGLEDNGIYQQSERSFNVDIQDNMYLQSARLLVNGEEVQVFDAEELQTAVSYKLVESEELLNITIEACDFVGNVSEKSFSNILVRQKQEVIPDEETTKDMTDDEQKENVIPVEQTEKYKLLIISIVLAACFMIGFAVVLKKKKEQRK